MTRMLLQRPQPSRNSVSPLVKAAKPNLEAGLAHRLHLSLLFGRSPLLSLPGDRTRRPDSIVNRCGCLRSRPNNRLSRSQSARLSGLSRPARLPSSVERHLPHLAHPILRRPRDHERLVDPRLELIQRRNRAAGNYPVLRVVAHRPVDTREFRIAAGGKPAL